MNGRLLKKPPVFYALNSTVIKNFHMRQLAEETQ
jgi:hypothetical protein